MNIKKYTGVLQNALHFTTSGMVYIMLQFSLWPQANSQNLTEIKINVYKAVKNI